MEEFFPLSFNKSDDEIKRGLSSKESKDIEISYIVNLDPRKIPDRHSKFKMTLVWDLDQTLISADGIDDEDDEDENTKLVIRPHAEEVLDILKRHRDVEFIIWTAGNDSHAKRVVNSLPEIHFDHIIARDYCWYDTENPVKDLNHLVSNNRILDSIILIDDRMDIGKKHPTNLLIVPPFYPKEKHASNDRTLLYLVNILHRAITLYRNHPETPFYCFLFSPLVEKCIDSNNHYYGVKCFTNKEELKTRCNSFIKNNSK